MTWNQIEANKIWRDAKRAAGLCTRCGKVPPLKGHMQCNACLRYTGARATEWQQRRRMEAVQLGRCTRCFAVIPEGWPYTACPTCTERARARRRKAKEAAQ